MEGKSLYYTALAIKTRDVTRAEIESRWRHAKKLYPTRHYALDRAFAVLGDPWLKFVYDSAGEHGLRAAWCETLLNDNLRKLCGARWHPRHHTDLWDSQDSQDGDEWRVADAAWAAVIERRKKFRGYELRNIHRIAMVGSLVLDKDRPVNPTAVRTLVRARRRLQQRADCLPRLETLVLGPEEPRPSPQRVKWPSTFPSAAWTLPRPS